MRSGKQFVWIIAACAALVAQATPPVLCFACDHPCCAARADTIADRADDADTAGSSGCPRCAAYSGLLPVETSQPPCDCQFDARQDQPLATSRSPAPQAADDTLASDVGTARLLVPPALGISRDYAALSLAIPIRPARILFGVWRN
jgi:hypothetical protein